MYLREVQRGGVDKEEDKMVDIYQVYFSLKCFPAGET